MTVVDTEIGLREQGRAKITSFEGGVQLPLGQTLNATNVQDAVSAIATYAGGSGTGIGDAPFDGTTYGRVNGTWANVLPVTGGNLTGTLVLFSDPTTPLGAATKQYADMKLALAGGLMTGPLTLNADPAAPLGAATKEYVDANAWQEAAQDGYFYGRSNASWARVVGLVGGQMTGPLLLSADPTAALGAVTKQYADTKVGLSGGTMTGALVLNADPTTGLGAATKQYVDNTKVALAGGTMSGPLILNADPVAALGAATKQYADTKAPIASPTFTGTVSAPTVTPGSDSTTKVATTAFVQSAISAISAGVTSISTSNGLSGSGSGAVNIGISVNGIVNVSLGQMVAHTYKGNNSGSTATPIDVPAAQVLTDIGGAPLASPALTGTPTAPTATTGTNTTQIATTAFVLSQVAAVSSGVTTIQGTNGITPTSATSGNVTLGIAANGLANASLGTMAAHTYKGNNTGSTATPIDVTAAQLLTDIAAAPLASPTFTGTPAAPTPSPGDSTTKIATTAFVAASFAPLAAPSLTGGVTINSGTTYGTSLTITGGNLGDANQGAQIRLTNTNASAGVQNKSFRVDANGAFDILSSNYGTNLLSLTDAGGFAVPSFTAAMHVDAYSGTGANNIVTSKWTADGNPAIIQFQKSRGTTIGSQAIVSSNDQIGQLSWYASDGSVFQEAAQIYCVADGTPVAGTSMPGKLVLQTTPSGSVAPVNRLVINNGGIGTYSPSVLAADTTIWTYTTTSPGYRQIVSNLNNSTADNSASRYALSTATPNMYGILEINNGVGGNGQLSLTAGAGVLNGMLIQTGAGNIEINPSGGQGQVQLGSGASNAANQVLLSVNGNNPGFTTTGVVTNSSTTNASYAKLSVVTGGTNEYGIFQVNNGTSGAGLVELIAGGGCTQGMQIKTGAGPIALSPVGGQYATAPTAPVTDNSINIATTAMVQSLLTGTFGISAARYGVATGNSASANTTALNNAITAAQALGGCEIFMPPGTINLAPITISGINAITLIGAGEFGTVLSFNNATGNCITWTGPSNGGGLRRMTINSSVMMTSGYAVYVNANASCLKFDDLFVTYMWNGFWISDSSETIIDNVYIRYMMGGYGIRVWGTVGHGVYACRMDHVIADNPYPVALVYPYFMTWAASTAVALGRIIVSGANIYQCTTAGTTGSTPPSGIPGTAGNNAWTTTISDGTVKWNFVTNSSLSWICQDSYAYSLSILRSALIDGAYGFLMQDTAGSGSSYPNWAECFDLETDHNAYCGIQLNGGLGFYDTNGWHGSVLNGNGVTINSSYKGDSHFTQCHCVGNWQYGVLIQSGPVNTSFWGGGYYLNSQQSSGLVHNIGIANNSSSVTITGVFAGRGPEGSGQTSYGVFVGTGCSSMTITGNVLFGNITGGCNITSSGSITVANNQ